MEVILEILGLAMFEERACFVGDDGGGGPRHYLPGHPGGGIADSGASSEVEAVQGEESFKAQHLPPSVVGIANIPAESLPPGIVLPRVP